jgi:5-oxoprolinase (ATP-hydrolysing)
VALWLAAKGFRNVSRSSALAPRIRLLPRAETAVVDAYLAPVIEGYLTKVSMQGAAARLLVMTSSGGLVPAERFQPKDSLLSGPAGGVVGAAVAGRRAGYDAVLAFDMGGTSTDVSRWAGALDYRFETRIGGARLLAPALRIETVAAGGGSICWFDGSQLKVGPESAAASPGPACYGAGGPLTLTDVNLLLGRLDANRFGLPLDPEASRRRARELAAAVAADNDSDIDDMLLGLLRIADERMAEAVRRISVRRGYAPAAHTLVAFGGAGPQHACALAELLGVGTVLVPRDAGLLSALGLGLARREAFAERQVLRRLDEVEDQVESWLGELAEEARGRLRDEGEVGPFDVRRLAALRLLGQESTLAVEARREVLLDTSFRRAYRELYGYPAQGRPVEVESLRVVVSVESAEEAPQPAAPAPRQARPTGSQRIRFRAGGAVAATFERAALTPGSAGSGPALVFEPHCTTVVEPGWQWRVGAAGGLVAER